MRAVRKTKERELFHCTILTYIILQKVLIPKDLMVEKKRPRERECL
jgi:hypothetical protein